MVELSLIGMVGILSIEVLSVWVGLGVLVSGIIFGTIMARQGSNRRREEKRAAQILEVEHQAKLKGEQVKLEREQVELKGEQVKLEREQVELEREQVELKSSEAKLEREQVESEKQQLRITVLEANLEKVNIELERLKVSSNIGDDDSRNSDRK